MQALHGLQKNYFLSVEMNRARSMIINIHVVHSKDFERRIKSLEGLILTAVLRKQAKTRPSLYPNLKPEKQLQKVGP